jgi:hypothetical protein
MINLARRSWQPALRSLDHHDLAIITGGTAAPAEGAAAEAAPAAGATETPAEAPGQSPSPPPTGGPPPAAGPGSGKRGCGDRHQFGRGRGRGRGRC